MVNITFRENIDLAKNACPKFPSRDDDFYILSIIKWVLISVGLFFLCIVFILWTALVEIIFVVITSLYMALITTVVTTVIVIRFVSERLWSRLFSQNSDGEAALTPKPEEKPPEEKLKPEEKPRSQSEDVPNRSFTRRNIPKTNKCEVPTDRYENEKSCDDPEGWEKLEKEKRKNNLVFFGIPEEEEDEELQQDLEAKILKIFVEKFGVNSMNLKTVHRQGIQDQSETRKPRPVVVSFENQEDRKLIFENRKKLKNTNLFVHLDLTVKERIINQKLYAFKKQKEKEGHRVELIGTQLKLDGRVYTLKE